MSKTTKAAQATTPKASAKITKFAPIIIKSTGDKNSAAWLALEALPVLRLKELLRARAIPINKRKEDMVERLAGYFDNQKVPFTITIG